MRPHALILGVATALFGTVACVPVDVTEIRVKDPRAVGVVANNDNKWLLPPNPRPETVQIAHNIGGTHWLSRSDSGSIDYVSEHWALGIRVDTTPLLDQQGRVGWTGSPGESRWFAEAVQSGGEVRLHRIAYVRQTGPFGLCNGTLFDSCIANPAVSMSLATDSRNIEEVDVVRTPVRTFGIFEVVFGSLLSGTGILAAGFGSQLSTADGRNAIVGISAGVVVLGGLTLANGLWRVMTPDRRFVYRASNRPPVVNVGTL